MASDPTVAALQHTLNRYAASEGGTAVLSTDGIWGSNTRTALLKALWWVNERTSVNQSIRQAAASYAYDMTAIDAAATRNAVLIGLNKDVLGPVADFFALKEIMPPSAGGGGGGGGYIKPGGGGGYIKPDMPDGSGFTPPDTRITTNPGASTPTTFKLFGLVLPRWSMYAGGGVLALAVIGLIATRKKPETHAP